MNQEYFVNSSRPTGYLNHNNIMSTTDEAEVNLNYQSQSSPLNRHKISTRIQK